MQKRHGVKCFIKGKVQGVWFRDTTRQKAAELGLTGFAKNLADGSVEVVAYGPRDTLEALYQWLHIGSPLSHVDNVTREDIAWRDYDGFDVL